MERINAFEDNTEVEAWFSPPLGASVGMREVLRLIRKVAPTEITVLIEGESGSGKEIAAQMIHALSQRAREAFCAVNCGAIAENLIASELFGHERGSFTGATSNHRGYFERASGGTLFLDEITEMPLGLQPSLLRVLETGRVLRVGGSEEIAINVRIVAATNRPAQESVRNGQLRDDLYYRLQTFPIRIPPLRERGNDIIALARHFLECFNTGHGTGKRLTPAAEQALLAYSWPGNVRELRNAIERAALLAETSIGPADLGLDALAPAVLPGGDSPAAAGPVASNLREAEKQLIMCTLSACDGNKRQAAQRLGISLKTLYNKLKSYGRSDEGHDGRQRDSAG